MLDGSVKKTIDLRPTILRMRELTVHPLGPAL
jgi:hypothetical protein